ncbi:sialidase family protein [Candidatus Latescibacterota bacterium]
MNESFNRENKLFSLSTMFAMIAFLMLSGTGYPQIHHVVVNKPNPGRAFGWPANGGIWSWENEILVMYLDCPYKDRPGFSNHDSDQSDPSSKWVTSRSLDGGVTWKEHRDAFSSVHTNSDSVKRSVLKNPIDFSNSDTIINFHWDGLTDEAKTYFYFSIDRGKNWKGPYDNIPLFDFAAMTGRTDYEVTGKHSLTAYMSCIEVDEESCYRESSYTISTIEGGITWQKGQRISRVLSPCGSSYKGVNYPLTTKVEYAAMPSTVRISPDTLISVFRSGDSPTGNYWKYGFRSRDGWIDITRSTDNGKTWHAVNGHIMDLPTLNSSPPALNLLPTGRLVCSWGHRLPDDGSDPTSIRARTSDDYGETWNETIFLREDGFDYDLGYNRQTIRPDGMIVTVYYYRTIQDGQSPTYIAATIWNPNDR